MILVTGGTGFLGAYLLTELTKQDKPVRALKRSKSSVAYTQHIFNYKMGAQGETLFAKITWVDGDIMDVYSVEEAMKGCDEVYHCATEVSLRDEDPDEIIFTAERGTENMVNVALECGIKKFCHVSSVAALGEYANGKEITEEAFEEFSFKNSPYAIGKHLAEAQVWRAHAEGLNVVVVCPTIILGPWKGKAGSMSFFYSLKKNSTFYTGGTMGYVDVDDVAAIMIRLMDENKMGERYIVTSENVSFHKLFTDIAQGIGRPIPKKRINKLSLLIFRYIHNLTNKHKLSTTMVIHSCGTYIFSNKKVTRTLNYTFMPVKQSIERSAIFFNNETAK